MSQSPPSSSSPFRSDRLAALPPYVLARVDELKSRLRAEGREVYDFGLGNPDGASPALAVDRLREELARPGFNRYMPSRGRAETRAAICDWYRRRYGVSFDPEREAVVTIGSKEGIGHLLAGLVNPGDTVIVPDPAYPIHQLGVFLAGGQPVPYPVGPGQDHAAAIERAVASAPRKPRGLIVNFPHNPTSALETEAFLARVVALARRESLWVLSDLAYADLVFAPGFPEGRAPSIFQVAGARDVAIEFFTVSKSYNMPGWRVGFAVGNPGLVDALGTIKGYMDYGSFAPTQLAAAAILTGGDAAVADIRALYRARAEVLVEVLSGAGWPVAAPQATMFVWARIPARFAALSAVEFSARLLEEAGVAVAPGTGFGAGGEGFVRFALVETDARVRAAGQAIARFLAG